MEPREPLASPGTSTSGEPPRPAVPGHDVVRLLGRGGFGDVWLLKERGAERNVAAKILRQERSAGLPGPPAAARRELRALRAVAHPHLLACHAAVEAEAGGAAVTALLSDYAAGGSLARLVAARGRLGVGETITAVGPIAQALAALHARGVTHSDVSPGNILFTAQGKPLLADLGAARLVGDAGARSSGTPGFDDPDAGPECPGQLSPGADVYGLGAVAWFCLAGSPPGTPATRPPLTLLADDVPTELAAAIGAALSGDPRERPTAAEFARAVFRSARAEPLDLAAAVEEEVLAELVTRVRPVEGRQRDDGRGRWLRAGRPRARSPWADAPPRRAAAPVRWALGLMLALGAALGVTWAVGAATSDGVAEPAPSGPGGAGTAWTQLPEALRRGAESSDPVQAVQALAEIRSRALGSADRGLLARINAVGSEAAAADTVLMDRLEAEGRRLSGFASRVLSAELVGDAPATRRAVVRVRVVTSGYAVLARDGTQLEPPGPGSDQTLRIVLEQAEEAWRVAQILSG